MEDALLHCLRKLLYSRVLKNYLQFLKVCVSKISIGVYLFMCCIVPTPPTHFRDGTTVWGLSHFSCLRFDVPKNLIGWFLSFFLFRVRIEKKKRTYLPHKRT